MTTHENTKLRPVTELSDSEESDDGQQIPEAGEHLPRKRRVKAGLRPRERLRDQGALTTLLQKRCIGICRQGCLKKFSKRHIFDKLLAFRRQWSELHKLDADRLVPSWLNK